MTVFMRPMIALLQESSSCFIFKHSLVFKRSLVSIWLAFPAAPSPSAVVMAQFLTLITNHIADVNPQYLWFEGVHQMLLQYPSVFAKLDEHNQSP